MNNINHNYWMYLLRLFLFLIKILIDGRPLTGDGSTMSDFIKRIFDSIVKGKIFGCRPLAIKPQSNEHNMDLQRSNQIMPVDHIVANKL